MCLPATENDPLLRAICALQRAIGSGLKRLRAWGGRRPWPFAAAFAGSAFALASVLPIWMEWYFCPWEGLGFLRSFWTMLASVPRAAEHVSTRELVLEFYGPEAVKLVVLLAVSFGVGRWLAGRWGPSAERPNAPTAGDVTPSRSTTGVRRWWSRCCALGCVALVAVAVLLGADRLSDRPKSFELPGGLLDDGTLKQVQVGMSRDQVESVVGPPRDTWNGYKVSPYAFPYRARGYESWIGDYSELLVLFDEHGRAADVQVVSSFHVDRAWSVRVKRSPRSAPTRRAG